MKESVDRWLETWAAHCGAPRKVFEGQFREMLATVLDTIDKRMELGVNRHPTESIRRELKLRTSGKGVDP
jgi:hypothetical protein